MNDYEADEYFPDFDGEYDSKGRPIRHTHKRSSRKTVRKLPQTTPVLSDFGDDATAWVPSYAAHLDPRHHERQWLIESLSSFYRDNVIFDVIRQVKSGKEANVYCCEAHPATGVELIAAKLYRPRILRTLKNDAIYKAGRMLRGEDGKELKGRREKLALQQKSKFGQHLDMVWWIGNEYAIQQKLHLSGANVPKPIGHNGNAVLMEYIGDTRLAAPTLSDVTLSSDEAIRLFKITMDNIRIMLDNHLVHGDLSAFNILYWAGNISIIDFPQVVNARTSPNAMNLLQRDIKRVCDYFARFGVKSDPILITRSLWEPYMGN